MAHRTAGASSLVVLGDSLSDNGNLLALLGRPLPPDWQGRFSNGPSNVEYLARALGRQLDDLAFGFAQASDVSPPLLTDPEGNRLPINLSDQLANYLAGLDGKPAPDGTTVLINIGSNDYDGYLISDVPKTAVTAQTEVTGVVSSIAGAIAALTAAGVQRIVLFTLPDLAIAPLAQSEGTDVAAFAHALDIANNTALAQLAATLPNVVLVDIFKLSEALAADPRTFDFTAPLSATWTEQLAAGGTRYAPNELAFFDGEHPTTAAHAAVAAFAEATLTADHVRFLDGTSQDIRAQGGDNFIFAVPINPAMSGLTQDYVIHGNAGNDTIFAGEGNVTVFAGAGQDFVFAGGGNARLFGGAGPDVLATNSLGTNLLAGGSGSDVIIANRGGTNVLTGGGGNDLVVLKESADLVDPDGSIAFGSQHISGGRGLDTLRFIANDQDPAAEGVFIAEFQRVAQAFDCAGPGGGFRIDGLDVTGIERLELQVDSVSPDPATPYLITHTLALSAGSAAPVGGMVHDLLAKAEGWNLLTV